jgi:hypothetical protein
MPPKEDKQDEEMREPRRKPTHVLRFGKNKAPARGTPAGRSYAAAAGTVFQDMKWFLHITFEGEPEEADALKKAAINKDIREVYDAAFKDDARKKELKDLIINQFSQCGEAIPVAVIAFKDTAAVKELLKKPEDLLEKGWYVDELQHEQESLLASTGFRVIAESLEALQDALTEHVLEHHNGKLGGRYRIQTSNSYKVGAKYAVSIFYYIRNVEDLDRALNLDPYRSVCGRLLFIPDVKYLTIANSWKWTAATITIVGGGQRVMYSPGHRDAVHKALKELYPRQRQIFKPVPVVDFTGHYTSPPSYVAILPANVSPTEKTFAPTGLQIYEIAPLTTTQMEATAINTSQRERERAVRRAKNLAEQQQARADHFSGEKRDLPAGTVEQDPGKRPRGDPTPESASAAAPTQNLP